MYTVTGYVLYVIASILLTIFVSRTLSKNGELYLIEGFGGDEALAKSVNHMLVVGFYLLNLGFVLLRMETGYPMDSLEQLIVYQSQGLGFVLFALGCLHFFNMYVIYLFREAQLKKQRRVGELEA